MKTPTFNACHTRAEAECSSSWTAEGTVCRSSSAWSFLGQHGDHTRYMVLVPFGSRQDAFLHFTGHVFLVLCGLGNAVLDFSLLCLLGAGFSEFRALLRAVTCYAVLLLLCTVGGEHCWGASVGSSRRSGAADSTPGPSVMMLRLHRCPALSGSLPWYQ